MCAGGRGHLCSFSRSPNAISTHQDLLHSFLGPAPRAWWKMPGVWTKYKHDPDLGAGREGYPAHLLGPSPPGQRMPPTAPDSSVLCQEVASANLPLSRAAPPHPTLKHI